MSYLVRCREEATKTVLAGWSAAAPAEREAITAATHGMDDCWNWTQKTSANRGAARCAFTPSNRSRFITELMFHRKPSLSNTHISCGRATQPSDDPSKSVSRSGSRVNCRSLWPRSIL